MNSSLQVIVTDFSIYELFIAIQPDEKSREEALRYMTTTIKLSNSTELAIVDKDDLDYILSHNTLWHTKGGGVWTRSKILPHEEDLHNVIKRVNCGFASKYKGVSFNKQKNKWMVTFSVRGRKVYGGLFTSEDDAGKVSDIMRLDKIGKCIVLNFPKT